MNRIFLLILGMTLVTYIPRALPAAFIERMRFSPRTERFLRLIPYTAMTALVFPGVLGVDEAHRIVGVLGALVALTLGWKKMPVLVTILGAIASVLIAYLCIA